MLPTVRPAQALGFVVRIRQGGGINLLDLLAALLVTSLLLGIALPGYTRINEHQRQVAELNRLQGLIQQARTLASLRDEAIHLCPSQNGSSCSASLRGEALLLKTANGQLLVTSPGQQTPIAFPDHAVTLLPLPARGTGATLLPCTGFRQVPARGVTFSTTGRVRINDDPPSSLLNRC